jgi:hypothetical protein
MAVTYTLFDTKRRSEEMMKLLKQITTKMINCVKAIIDEELEVLDFFYNKEWA